MTAATINSQEKVWSPNRNSSRRFPKVEIGWPLAEVSRVVVAAPVSPEPGITLSSAPESTRNRRAKDFRVLRALDQVVLSSGFSRK